MPETVNTKPVLVVVDMQTGFEAAHELATINAVAREILKAKEAKQWIVFLEYDGENDGETHPCLMNLVRDYRDYEVMVKGRDDGSDRVAELCVDYGLTPECFVVCGVNTAACVYRTVRGLTKNEFPDTPVRVIQDACNGYPGCRSFDSFYKLSNVILD